MPGLFLAIALTVVAKVVSVYAPTLGTTLLALILGIVFRQFVTDFGYFSKGVAWTEKYVLEAAIVLIGFGFEISKFNEIGLSVLGVLFGSVVLILALTLLFRRFFRRQDGTLFLLLGAGSAICGSSAIGATAPLVQAKEEETGISLAVINLLGLLGMVLLPFLASIFAFTDLQTGVLLGGILQSVGHVVGSSFTINPEVGQFATVIKMGRVSFLIPFLLIIYFMFRKKADGTKLKFPVFILLFLGAVLISHSPLATEATFKQLSKSGDMLLNIGMAAIGLKINLKSLWEISGKAFITGITIFLVQIFFFLGYLLWVR